MRLSLGAGQKPVQQEKMSSPTPEEAAKEWVPHLSQGRRKLKRVLKEMEPFALNPKDVPFVIQLVENPKYDIGLFSGSTTLGTHDCIHILLGRGVLLKDEAFVIGYTMGSSKKMKRWRRNLFMFICKYFYPEGYRFGEEERFIFNLGVIAGSRCPTDLSQINFEKYLDKQVNLIRGKLGIDVGLLKACYLLEKKCFIPPR